MNTKTTITVLLALLVTPGCYNPKVQRDRANALAIEVDRYRDKQRERIDEINRQYRFEFEHIINDLIAAEDAKVDHEFDLAAQKVADDILSAWQTQTLPRRFRDTVADGVEAQRARMAAADQAIATARAAFAGAFKEVELDLAQLKTVKGRLDTMAIEEDRFRTVAQFIQTTAKIYQDLQKKAQAKQTGTK